MTTLRRIAIMLTMAVIPADASLANEPVDVIRQAVGERRDPAGIVINSQTGSVAGITVGMTEARIREAGWPYETGSEILEGDEYRIYELRLPDDIRLKCTLDHENRLYRIESSSPRLRDEYGLGAGSRLNELQQFYPGGRLITGTAEGRFARFLTGTHLVFRFDHKELDDSCFDYHRECSFDEAVQVRSLEISRRPLE